jgi:DNA topoisomerase III
MAKTLVIAEKPSVGQDLARVLPGPFEKHTGSGERTTRWLEGPEHIVTWAVGHLVQLAEPDEYDDKYKKWRMADLPIVPRHFKLVVRDERSQKQMAVVRDLLRRDDVDRILNACDAGREGELIFKWIIEKAGGGNGSIKGKPIERLWLSSMTRQAMRDALAHTRPDEEMKQLEEAAKSRSEADWIVGMNATRAATIRLRSSFDGAVSLGRVQTPTLAILTKREEEIRAFKPEKYWLVDARFATDDDRRYAGRFHDGPQPRLKSAAEADAIVAAVSGKRGEITKVDKSKRTERPPLLFDLTSLQRDANTRYGFSARRTLAAAQRCYEEHKVLTYPRTSSRYLTSDMVPEIKPTAAQVGRDGPEYAKGAEYVTGLDLLPLGRVVDDAKVGDHHAIIPTNSQHDLSRLNQDDRRIFDLVARRFLAVFHPEAVFENTRVETTVEQYVFRTRGRVLIVPGWRGVYGELPEGERSAAEEDEGADQQLPRLERGEPVTTREAEALEKETKPPRRYTDASLLGAMETAGKLVDDDELREAMKDSGIGTPATRAAIIERLIDVGYVEREARALVATEKGLNVIRLLGDHALTSPALTGDWERRLGNIERGEERRERFMSDIAEFAGKTVGTLDTTLKDVRIPRANLGPCPVCGHDIVENRKGFSCWSREDPGCGFVIWKAKAGKQLPPAVARELIATGRTEKPVTGFKGRSGRSFRARLALQQGEDGKWRVEFDEPWAREGAKPPEEEPADGAAEAGAASDSPAAAA